MIVTVASFKGGVGKTTTAVHIAAFLCRRGSTLLLDGDENRSATGWGALGKLPFQVADERKGVKLAPKYEHLVIDTQARPSIEDLKALAEGCDVLIIPTTADTLALNALMLTLQALKSFENVKYRVLLTIVEPKPNRDGDEARATLTELEIPIFKRSINRFIAFKKAALKGVTVLEVADPRARTAWDQYEDVGEEVIA